jgi:hypothetical protein
MFEKNHTLYSDTVSKLNLFDDSNIKLIYDLAFTNQGKSNFLLLFYGIGILMPVPTSNLSF